MPLRIRLILLYGSLLAIILILFAALLYVTLLTNLSNQLDSQLRSRASDVAQNLRLGADQHLGPEDFPPGRLAQLAQSEGATPGLVVLVLDERGRVIGSSDSAAGGPRAPELTIPPTDQGDLLAYSAPNGDERVLVRPLAQDDGRLVGSIQVAASLGPTRATMESVLVLLALGTGLALLVATAVGWWLAGRVLRPLRQITSKARSIARTGEIGERLSVGPERDEVGQLALAFNAMINRLDEAAQRQRAFLADTSHELRSPLTVLRGNLDLLRRDDDPLARADYLREADAEAKRMARLVNDLLLLGQSDARQSVQLVPLALEDVVREVYEQALMLSEGPSVRARYSARATVLGDVDRLKQLLWNLVENAVRHTPDEGRVDLVLTVEDQQAVVRVVDTGEGIAAEHLPRIFDRFYKVDRSRSRAKGGTGLGLAIVRYLAEAHGGRVEVASTVGVGTMMTLRLTLSSQERPAASDQQSAVGRAGG